MRRMRPFARPEFGDVEFDGYTSVCIAAEYWARFSAHRKILKLVDFRGQRSTLRRGLCRCERCEKEGKLSTGVGHVNQCTDSGENLELARVTSMGSINF